MGQRRERDPGLTEAAARAGGISHLSTKLGLTRAAACFWTRTPPHQVLAVERLTGVPRHELRPDLYPPPPEPPSAGVVHDVI